MLKLAAFFFSIYFLANYFTTAAYGKTSPGSVSILASTGGAFTLVIGFLAKVEKLSFLRILSIIISVGGILIISAGEFKSGDSLWLGNLFAVVSAFLYGCYSVLLKKIIVDEDRLDMTFFFGVNGALTMIFIWPVFFILHYSGLEVFILPNQSQTVFLIFNSLCAISAGYLWILAMKKTTPIVVAVGLSLNIPLTLLVELVLDFIRGKEISISPYKYGSAVCVLIGFVVVNVATMNKKFDQYLDAKFCCSKRRSDIQIQ